MGLGRTLKKVKHGVNKHIVKPIEHTGKKTVTWVDQNSGKIVKDLKSREAFQIYGAIVGSTAGSVLDIAGPLGIAADIAIGEATSEGFAKLHDKYVANNNNKKQTKSASGAIQIQGSGGYSTNNMTNIYDSGNWAGPWEYKNNPLLEFSGDDNPVIFEKREFCFDVITSPGYTPGASQPFPPLNAATMTNQQYPNQQFNGNPPAWNDFYQPGALFQNTTAAINPGLNTSNGGIFNYLAPPGQSFQNYFFHFLEIEYEPTCGEFGPAYSPTEAINPMMTSAAPNFRGQLGTIILGIQYDSTEEPWTTQEQAMNSEGAVQTASNKPCKLRVQTSKNKQAYNLFLVRQSDFTIAQQPDLYDIGRLNVITQGYPTPNITIGKIWVTYKVEFQKFRPSTSGRQTRTASYYVVDVDPNAPTTGGFGNATPLGFPTGTQQGLVPTQFNQMNLSFDYSNARIFLPPLMNQGMFQMTLKWVMAALDYPNVDNMPNDGIQYYPIGNNVRTVNCMSTNRTGLGPGITVTQDKTFFMGQNFSNAGPTPTQSQEVTFTMFFQVTGQNAFIQLPIGNNVWNIPDDTYWLSLIITELNAAANPGLLQTSGST